VYINMIKITCKEFNLNFNFQDKYTHKLKNIYNIKIIRRDQWSKTNDIDYFCICELDIVLLLYIIYMTQNAIFPWQ